MHLGIIGCSNITKKHLAAISSIAAINLEALCDLNAERLSETNKKYAVKTYTSYEDFLRNPDIDTVLICTPSGLHASMAIQAAKAGKNIITEKPIALSVKDGEKMIEEARENNVKLYTIKQYRFSPPLLKIHEAISKKRFGKLILSEVSVVWQRPQEYYDQVGWRGTKKMDGGVLFNQSSHHIDMMQWLMGDVASVMAYDGILNHNIETPDTTVAVIKFKNGALGTIKATTCSFTKDIEAAVTILGEKGYAKVGGPRTTVLEAWQFADQKEEDDHIQRDYELEPYYCHQKLYEHILDSQKSGKPSMLEFEEGVKSIQIIEAIHKSAKEKREIKNLFYLLT